ncbi:hypothetical protein, partial [Archangium sp.]|uniref:hypothetical protein n=1 Tax=Archangium sp. TaxID=1872627 RepID=UPI002ED7CE9B
MLGWMGAGCAAPRPPVKTDSVEVERPAAPAEEGKPTESEPQRGPKLRSWVLRGNEAKLPSHARSAFQRKLELVSGPVEVLGFEEHAESGGLSEVSVLLLQPASGEEYVVNAWTSLLPQRVTLSLADTWVSPERKLALLLVRLTGPQESRWVVLGTDGRRAWFALGTSPEEQL